MREGAGVEGGEESHLNSILLLRKPPGYVRDTQRGKGTHPRSQGC